MSDKIESFNYYNNPLLNYQSKINNFDSVQNMNSAEFAALATLYMYDSKSVDIPFKTTSSFNGQIDENEFKDTKEQYEKKIAEIKALAPKYGKNLSEINIPTYEEFKNMSFRSGVGLNLLQGLFSKKKSLDDEIGLKGQKYTSETIGLYDEKRIYEDGTIAVITYRTPMHQQHHKIVVYRTDNSSIEKSYNNDTRAIEYIIERKTDIDNSMKEIKTNFSPSGRIESVEHKGELPYQKTTYHNSIKQHSITYAQEDNQKIAKDLIEATKGFFTNKAELQKLSEQITNDNAWEIYNEFKNITGKNILDCIKDDDTRFTLRDKLSHGYKQGAEIPNFKEFSQMFTYDILDDLKNNLSLEFIIDKYEECTGRRSLEYDITNSNLPDEEKKALLEPFELTALCIQSILRDGKCKNTQIKNEYYTGNIYDIEYNDNTIAIHNKTSSKDSILDIDKVCSSMSTLDKVKMHLTLQGLPAEVLEEMAIEIDSIYSSNNHNMHLLQNNTREVNGYYTASVDAMVTNTMSEEVITHELGHSIYCLSNKEMLSGLKSKFKETYNNCIKKYQDNGYTKYSYEDGYKPKDKTSNYCTYSAEEMFAECYTLLMLGECQSKDVILKYFSECLKETAALLKEIRNLPDEQRHIKK